MTTPSAPSSTLARLVPGADMLRTYDRSWLRPDLLAGVTVWAMLVPQGLGYATLAGMPAVAGLYAAFGALLLDWLYEAPLMPARLGAANRVLRSDSSGGYGV